MIGITTTPNRVPSIPKNATIYIDKHFQGVSHARNELLKKFYDEGHEYICICDDDLIYHREDWLQLVIDVMKKSNTNVTCLPHTLEGVRADLSHYLETWTSYIGAFYLMHRSVLESVGYFSNAFKGYGFEDVHYKFRLESVYGQLTNPKILPYLVSSMDVLNLNPTPSINNKSELIELNRPIFLKELNNGQIYYPYANNK